MINEKGEELIKKKEFEMYAQNILQYPFVQTLSILIIFLIRFALVVVLGTKLKLPLWIISNMNTKESSLYFKN